jgi:hypothetical protein
MSILTLGLQVPDLHILRSYPCSAMTAPGTECGATPASKYLRQCGTVSHSRLIWLCPVHAALAISGGAICKMCAERLGVVRVTLTRISEPLRIA